MKVKFVRNAVYETEGPGKGPRYKAGEVHDFADDFAQRWIRRGVAVAVEGTKPTKVGSGLETNEQSQVADVEIPDDWQSLHHATKKKLARELTGIDHDTVESAEEAIEAALAARSA